MKNGTKGPDHMKGWWSRAAFYKLLITVRNSCHDDAQSRKKLSPPRLQETDSKGNAMQKKIKETSKPWVI